jgi:hypothetical protein
VRSSHQASPSPAPPRPGARSDSRVPDFLKIWVDRRAIDDRSTHRLHPSLPLPSRIIFTRADHTRFSQRGRPATSWGAAILGERRDAQRFCICDEAIPFEKPRNIVARDKVPDFSAITGNCRNATSTFNPSHLMSCLPIRQGHTRRNVSRPAPLSRRGLPSHIRSGVSTGRRTDGPMSQPAGFRLLIY